MITDAKPEVVVVEDDPSVLRSLRRLLAAAGYLVRTFDRPAAVLQTQLPTADACLIVDIHLPEMTGVEMCDALAAAGSLLPVIFITGHLDEHTMTMTRNAKAIAVLIKPFGRAQLLEAVSAALVSCARN